MGGGSKSTNWKPPSNDQDGQAVSGLLAEVEKLTGKHVKKHHAPSPQDAQMPAFARDFDDDDDSNSNSAPEESHRQKVHEMSWGQVIPGTMGSLNSGMSALQSQQQEAMPVPAAPVAPVQAAPETPPAANVNSYLNDLSA